MLAHDYRRQNAPKFAPKFFKSDQQTNRQTEAVVRVHMKASLNPLSLLGILTSGTRYQAETRY
jgi:hypothetical protein